MNSDELGEKGESRFRELCADAGLVCNKSDRDRTGWDFIVEFPFAESEAKGQSFDARISPISCHIQVKTLWEDSAKFKMRLTSAERLAKELKPSFVYVLKVNRDSLGIKKAYLIHLLGNRLGAILKRLRREQANGTRTEHLNKITMSMTPSDSESIGPSGDSLREALLAACNTDLHLYSLRKNEQLKRIGFDTPPIEGHISFELSPSDDIGDILLGIKKEIPVSHFKTFTKRFGIRLPDVEFHSGKITFEPQPADSCSVTIRDESPIPPVIFSGRLFLSPLLALTPKLRESGVFPTDTQGKVARISCDLLEATFSSGLFEIGFSIGSAKLAPPDSWRQVWRGMHALSSGVGTVKIVAQKRAINFEIKIPENNHFPSMETCRYWMTICESASFLLREAGIHPEPQLEFGDIERNADDIFAAAAILRGEPLSLSATCETESAFELSENERCIIANTLQLGSISVGYFCIAGAQSELISKNSYSLVAEGNLRSGARLLASNPSCYDAFVSSVMKNENIRLMVRIDRRPSFVELANSEAACE
jgi:hypothetical protein